MTNTSPTSRTIGPVADAPVVDHEQDQSEQSPVVDLYQDQPPGDPDVLDEPAADLQQDDLHACEEIIERVRFNGWVEIGKALKIIRDKDLYQQGPYGTFDEYVRRRWDVERTYAHRLIKAAEVYANLLSIDNIKLPTAEGQVRPLVRLNPSLQQKAWKIAVRKAGQYIPTAKDVAASVLSVAPRRPEANQVKKTQVDVQTSDGNESNITAAIPVPPEMVPLLSESHIAAGAPGPLELHTNAEVTVQPADGVGCVTPDDDTEQSTGGSGKDAQAMSPVDDGPYDEAVNVDLPIPDTRVDSKSETCPSVVASSASVVLDHTGDAPPGVHLTERQALIPVETVARAVASVTARDLGASTDREMVVLVRDLVSPVADLLGQLADAYPGFSGRELSQALGMANTKLQIASGWV